MGIRKNLAASLYGLAIISLFIFGVVVPQNHVYAYINVGGSGTSIPNGECKYKKSANDGDRVECNLEEQSALVLLSLKDITKTKASYESEGYIKGAYSYLYKLSVTSSNKDSGKLTASASLIDTGRSLAIADRTVVVKGTAPKFESSTTGTCSDGVKNGDETGIDSGGRCTDGGGGGTEVKEDPAEPLGISLLGAKVTGNTAASTKGCVNGKYPNTSILLAGLPCETPISNLDEVTTFVKNLMNNIIFPSLGTIFIIMIIFGGISYISSNGNEQRAEKAKKVLTAAIIGLLIVILSSVIIWAFAQAIGGGA